MEGTRDILYLFLHMPKCAGGTFRYHIFNNAKKEETLAITRDLQLKPRRPLSDISPLKKAVEKHLSNLTQERRAKIKLIHGHWIPYGIHTYFNKFPRYITFLRDPFDRAVSSYNFLVTLYHRRSLKKFPLYDLESQILEEGKIPPFERWLETKFDCTRQPTTATTMTRFLKTLGYMEDGDNTKELIKKTLSKFYFTGITEQYDVDSLFLYHLLGIRKFYGNQNVSEKYFSPQNSEREGIKRRFLSKHQLDQALYEHALEINKEFKENSKNFYKTINYMRIKRVASSSLAALLNHAYYMSAQMKSHSGTYSRLVGFIKNEP